MKPHWDELSDAWGNTEEYLRKLSLRPIAVRYLYSVHWCDAELRNGGFQQFFWNTTGIVAPEAVEGFRAIGAPELAEIVEEAMGRLSPTYSRDRTERQRLLDSLRSDPHVSEESDDYFDDESFADLDSRYYDWLHSRPDGWEPLADEYARRSTAGSN